MSEAGSGQSTALINTALQYATHLLPFASFLQADRQLEAIVLSLIVKLPLTVETASTVAKLFHDAESMEAEIRSQLDRTLEEWQGLFLVDNQQPGENVDSSITSHNGQTLGMVYREKVNEYKHQLDKRWQVFGAYYERLFTAGHIEVDDLLIGSRPFESCSDFLVCLNTFYSISFRSCIESECTCVPLIAAFASTVRQTQLEVLPAKVTKKRKFARSVSLPRVKSTVATNFDIANNAALQKDPNSTEIMRNTNNNNSNALYASSAKAGHNTVGVGLIDSLSGDSRIRPPTFVDYLSESVLPPTTVERLEFGGEIAETERLVEWLNGWAVRERRDWNDAVVRPSTVLRVRVSPQLLAYSLWLIDSRYQRGGFTPSGVGDVTVAMVHSQVPASSPCEPSAPLADGGVRVVEATSLRAGHRHLSSRTRSSAAGQEASADQVTDGRKSRKKKSGKKPVRRGGDLHDEDVNGVKEQTWSWEASSLQPRPSESHNKSANNNVDRYHVIFCLPLCVIFLFFLFLQTL